jgi:hypothetical protein
MTRYSRVLFLYLMLSSPSLYAADSIRLIRSLSGPSGKVVGAKYEFDEKRNRFIYPQDKSVVIYFEWEVSPGDYTLTALWKDPSGRVYSMSPDLKIQTKTTELNAFWVDVLTPNRNSGIWTIEIRINDQPAGFHAYELVYPEPAIPVGSEVAKAPTKDELYRSLIKSLVWVYKLDQNNRRIDASNGFIVASDSILTAFQAIDSANRLEIEFANGSRVISDQIMNYSRLQDWAIIKAATGDVVPLPLGKSEAAGIGERLILLESSGKYRTLREAEVSGRTHIAGFGERIHLYPSPIADSVGGPLVDSNGKVLGVIGGSLTPGMRSYPLIEKAPLTTPGRLSYSVTITPIDSIEISSKSSSISLASMLEKGVLTPLLSTIPVISYGATTGDYPDVSVNFNAKTKFSRNDSAVFVLAIWEQKENIKKGVVSLKVYDAQNRLRLSVKPLEIKLPKGQRMRTVFQFAPSNFEPGSYRLDFLWDDAPVLRTGISIVE